MRALTHTRMHKRVRTHTHTTHTRYMCVYPEMRLARVALPKNRKRMFMNCAMRDIEGGYILGKIGVTLKKGCEGGRGEGVEINRQ